MLVFFKLIFRVVDFAKISLFEIVVNRKTARKCCQSLFTKINILN